MLANPLLLFVLMLLVFFFLYVLSGPKIGGEDTNASALSYLQMAANGGHPGAQTKLGECYSEGKYGLEAGTWKEARKWFRLAARQGYAEACVLLGNMYLNGEGVPTNVKVATKHYRVAAEKNNSLGMYLLGKSLCEGGGKKMPPNPKIGVPWLRKASKNNSTQATKFLESMNLLGQTITSPQKKGHNHH